MAEFGVTEWTLNGALDEMERIHNTMKDRQFAFILGAGASFTSGIPTGQHLAERWLKDLHLRECSDGRSIESWIAECGVAEGGFTLKNAAEYYPRIFERRFEGDREAGYAELEAAMEGKAPSLGYSLLAEIIQHTRHKVVVTTNFDNLVADALAMHAHQSPLVVAHESLAGFVRPQMRRPLVAKIHRDLYLHPINDPAGVSTMEQGWKIALKKLFQYFTPVVVGYGGNDGSLMNMLMGLDQGDIAGRMIWCYRADSPPPEKALNVLSKHKGLLVKIPGFDEFMLQLAAKLVSDFDVAEIAERTEKLGQERATRYREQASNLRESSLLGSPAEQQAGEVLSQSLNSSNSWWAWQVKAKAEPDIEKRKLIYLEGMTQFPNSPDLAGNYASFLDIEYDDLDETESMYEKAISLDPDNARNIGNYATFIEDHRRDYDKAEALYKKAIELDPDHGNNISGYANFLVEHRQDYDAAEALYRKALELAPNNGWNMCNFANFMYERRNDLNAAENLYRKAIELNPNSTWSIGNYANFLAYKRKKPDAARVLFEKAIELEPNSRWNRSNLAKFLASQGVTN
jgi:tetratricopeptide (TPR) repeat protein